MVFLDVKTKLESEMKEKLYTVSEVAAIFNVSRQTAYNWLEGGKFPHAFEVGSGKGTIMLITEADVNSLRREVAQEHIDALMRLGFVVTIDRRGSD